MKTFTRIIAVVMVLAVLATLMSACGKKKGSAEDEKGFIDEKLVGTWEGDDGYEDCTWTFNDDYTCTLNGSQDHFNNAKGTYKIADLSNGKIDITLNGWDEVRHMTYTCTEKALLLNYFEITYACTRKQ